MGDLGRRYWVILVSNWTNLKLFNGRFSVHFGLQSNLGPTRTSPLGPVILVGGYIRLLDAKCTIKTTDRDVKFGNPAT